MSEQSFSTSILVDQTPQEVFEAVTNVRGWWAADGLNGNTAAQDDVFTFEVPNIHRSKMVLTEVVPNERVVWLAEDNWMSFIQDKGEWNGTEIHFDIAEKGDKTELRFTHVGLVPEFECYEACSGAWAFYVQESLRDLIATGKGQPASFPDEVELVAQQAEQA